MAGVSRGALYHHFQDKEALFEAAFRDAEDELQRAAAAPILEMEFDPWRQQQEGLQSFLSVVAKSRDLQRILLIDGPAVLGWVRWRQVEAEFTLGLLIIGLQGLMDRQIIKPRAVEPLAHLVLAALNEAALLIAHADDPEATRVEVGGALRALMEGLR